jgi:hypothetical protein
MGMTIALRVHANIQTEDAVMSASGGKRFIFADQIRQVRLGWRIQAPEDLVFDVGLNVLMVRVSVSAGNVGCASPGRTTTPIRPARFRSRRPIRRATTTVRARRV